MINVDANAVVSSFNSTISSPTSAPFHPPLNCSEAKLFGTKIGEWDQVNKALRNSIGLKFTKSTGFCFSSPQEHGKFNRSFSPIFEERHRAALKEFFNFTIDRGDRKDFFSNPCFEEGVDYLRNIFSTVIRVVRRYLNPIRCNGTRIDGGDYLKGSPLFTMFAQEKSALMQNQTGSILSISNATCHSINPKDDCKDCLNLKVYGIPQKKWLFFREIFLYRLKRMDFIFKHPILMGYKNTALDCIPAPMLKKDQAKAMKKFFSLLTSNEGIRDLIQCRRSNLPCIERCNYIGHEDVVCVAMSIIDVLLMELRLFRNGRISNETELVLPLPKRFDD